MSGSSPVTFLNVTLFGKLMRVDLSGFLVNPDEAKIVKEIFDLYLSGYGVQKIANTLNKRSVRTEKIPFWHLDTIRGILRNEKYMGDLLLQKSLSESHLTKRQVKNEGQLQQFYITDDHEPIVSRAVFSETQSEVQRRAETI